MVIFGPRSKLGEEFYAIKEVLTDILDEIRSMLHRIRHLLVTDTRGKSHTVQFSHCSKWWWKTIGSENMGRGTSSPSIAVPVCHTKPGTVHSFMRRDEQSSPTGVSAMFRMSVPPSECIPSQCWALAGPGNAESVQAFLDVNPRIRLVYKWQCPYCFQTKSK